MSGDGLPFEGRLVTFTQVLQDTIWPPFRAGSITTRLTPGGKLRIMGRKTGNYVLIEIEDTGPGIPEAIRDRLFEPFVTAGKRDGLGLGLALSRQTVINHGGGI